MKWSGKGEEKYKRFDHVSSESGNGSHAHVEDWLVIMLGNPIHDSVRQLFESQRQSWTNQKMIWRQGLGILKSSKHLAHFQACEIGGKHVRRNFVRDSEIFSHLNNQ